MEAADQRVRVEAAAGRRDELVEVLGGEMTRRLPATIPTLAVLGNLPVARARDRLRPERVATVQSRLLGRLVRYAYAKVPYYRDTWDGAAVAQLAGPADLAGLPVLDRRVLNEIGSQLLLADGFSAANTRQAHTSGSTGVPVTLHYSERDLSYLRATYLWDMLACGLRPFDRIGFVRVGAFRPHRLERFGIARNIHINTGLDQGQQAAAFLAGRPTFLWGFPNAIAALVAELKRRRIAYRGVNVVMFGGESLADAARAEVLRYFGARGHEAYSSVEAYTIARSCPRGALHLRSGDVVVEVEHDDGSVSVADGEGEILVTRLRAEAMPLVRYRLGDRVRITPNDCPCGVMHTPIVRRILGRVEDQLATRDGRSRNGDHLASLLAHVQGIRQYQIVQRRPGEVEVVIVPVEGATARLVADARRALAPATNSYTVAVSTTDRIVPEPNGKIRLVKRLG
jgi:phenylacetate-CoA ligase